MKNLSDEIVVLILSMCTPWTACHLRWTCKQWFRPASSDGWRSIRNLSNTHSLRAVELLLRLSPAAWTRYIAAASRLPLPHPLFASMSPALLSALLGDAVKLGFVNCLDSLLLHQPFALEEPIEKPAYQVRHHDLLCGSHSRFTQVNAFELGVYSGQVDVVRRLFSLDQFHLPDRAQIVFVLAVESESIEMLRMLCEHAFWGQLVRTQERYADITDETATAACVLGRADLLRCILDFTPAGSLLSVMLMRRAERHRHTGCLDVLLEDERMDLTESLVDLIKYEDVVEVEHVRRLAVHARTDLTHHRCAPMAWAIQFRRIEVVHELLRYGPEGDGKPDKQYTLNVACEAGFKNMVEELLADASVDPTQDGNFALYCACNMSQKEIVELLLADERVTDAIRRDNYDYSRFHATLRIRQKHWRKAEETFVQSPKQMEIARMLEEHHERQKKKCEKGKGKRKIRLPRF